jgi:hypothetical protein
MWGVVVRGKGVGAARVRGTGVLSVLVLRTFAGLRGRPGSAEARLRAVMKDVYLYLHLLAMAYFVGGQLFLAASVVPALRGSEDREPVRAIARAFGKGSLAALAVLVVTGSAMASDDGLWDSSTLHAKLALVVVAILLVVLHTRRPQQHVFEGLIFVVSLVIVGLGLSLAT